MGVQLPKQKKNPLWFSILYRLRTFVPLSKKQKLRLFLNLEWAFDRLAQEASFEYYPIEQHPFRTNNQAFILDFIEPQHKVLDLGCGLGFVSYIVSEKAQKVVGIDYSNKDILRAKNVFKRDNLAYHCTDALSFLQENTERFDILMLSHILEHIEAPELFLQKFKGYFDYIFIELPDFEKTLLNPIRQDLRMTLIQSDDDHVVEFDRVELTTLLARNALEIVQSEYKFGLQRYWCKVK
jgi:SAM-dependent methyltransferase